MASTRNPPEQGSSEHRRQHRQRVLKGGTIIAGIQNSEVSCTLRNQNAGGAELKVAPESRVPDQFLLYVPVDGVAYRAQVRWRRNDRVGVQFTGTEPKPQAALRLTAQAAPGRSPMPLLLQATSPLVSSSAWRSNKRR